MPEIEILVVSYSKI